IPALLRGSDQRLLEPSAPNDRSAEMREDRLALAPVSCVGLGPGRLSGVRIGRGGAQFNQIEHMDWAGPVVGAKSGERLFGRIDISGHAPSPRLTDGARSAASSRPTLQRIG